MLAKALPPALPAPALAPFVRVTKLAKHFGELRALDGLTLGIARGEALCLLGPNGAGKTTLLHALAGLLRPDAGSVSIGDLGDPCVPAARRAVGFVPQRTALYAQLTVAENLRFFGRVGRVPERALDARVRGALALAGLEARAEQRAGTLSGGMQRRLNLACALVHEPQLLLLDEPTAGVDAQARDQLLAAIARLKSGWVTVVWSTHLLDEAERLGDRIAVIDRGRLRALGTRAELLAQHARSDLQALLLAITTEERRA